MSRIRRGSEAEWRAFGREVFDLRNQLQKVAIQYQELIPVRLTDGLLNTVEQIDRFRSKAEDEMFLRGGPQDLDVWYPGDETKERESA